MTLKQLEYFKQICRYGSFTKAASELYIAQPTLTLAVHQLEEELGVQLFIRKNRRVTLTKDGEFFLARATSILLDVEKLENDMKYLAEKKNLIRMGVPLMISVPMYPILFKDFQEMFPEIRIEISESGALGIIKNIIDETIDIAITSLDREYSTFLVERKLFDSKVCFCVNREHPLANREKIRFEETLDEKLVTFSGGFYINKLVQKYYDQYERTPNVILSTSQLYTIKSLIANNVASAFLLGDCILETDNIVAIPLEENIISEIGIITKKGGRIYPGMKQMIEFFDVRFGK